MSERDPTSNRWRWATVAAVALLGAATAGRARWIGDDAYISIRHAEKLIAGHGLVFNAGERVEGITNPLWTLWIALGAGLGVDPVAWCVTWGVLAFALCCGLLTAMALPPDPAAPGGPRPAVPWAGLILALHPDAAIWGSSGLETGALSALMVGALACGLERAPGDPRRPRPGLAGLLTGLAAGTRPDAVLLAPALFVLAFAGGRAGSAAEGRARALRYGAVTLALLLAIHGARFAYYGELLPNTYHAKSAGLARWDQGLVYLRSYYARYGVHLIGLPLLVLVAWPRPKPESTARARAPHIARALAPHVARAMAATVTAVIYTVYVVRVGGDFMYARLLVPTAPLLLMALEVGLRPLPLRWALVVGVAAMALPRLLPSPLSREVRAAGIRDERRFYAEPRAAARWAARSEVVRTHLGGTGARVAFTGSYARTVRDAGLDPAIEAETGLTDPTIARQPLATRGRPGHEKPADPRYLADARRVHFVLGADAHARLGLGAVVPPVAVTLPDPSGVLERGVTLWVVRWEPRRMASLAAGGAELPDIAAVIDAELAEARADPSRCPRTLRRLDRLYFEQAPGDPRRAELLAVCPVPPAATVPR